MAGGSGSSSTVPSTLPPPRPKSPPQYPDLYGKRRETARVQMLEREISFLQEDLKFVDRLQPASQCCKEVADFVVGNADPFIPTSQKARRSRHFWKWLCGAPCFSFSWICCCLGCTPHLEMPECCNCSFRNCCSCISCAMPKCQCCSCPCSCSWPRSQCFENISCIPCCCKCSLPQCPSCPDCPCRCRCRCKCSRPKCPKVNPCCCCCCCTKNCWYNCCFCY